MNSKVQKEEIEKTKKLVEDETEADDNVEKEDKETAEDKGVKNVNQNVVDDDITKIELVNVEKISDDIFGDQIKVNFEIENKSDSKIIIQPKDTSINCYMVDDIAVMSTGIMSGKKAKDALTLDSAFMDEGEELPELNEDLEMTLIVIGDDTYDNLGEYNVHIDFKII